MHRFVDRIVSQHRKQTVPNTCQGNLAVIREREPPRTKIPHRQYVTDNVYIGARSVLRICQIESNLVESVEEGGDAIIL